MHLTPTAYGTWSGGRFMHFGEALDEARYIGAVQHAYQSGIRTFMTADTYGKGEADTMLGKALAGIDRSSYCLVGAVGHDFYNGERSGSKGFPRFTDPALRSPAGYTDYVQMATEKSLERLGASAFDVLMLHNPDQTGYTSAAVWDAMDSVKQKGLVEMLGLAPGPANGFTLDIINCFEKFGSQMDWAMLILNPLEPWPGSLALPAAEKFGVKVVTRVVDYGGVFHDDVKPGHLFGERDHRTFRPQGWVDAAYEKLKKLRPISERHGITMLQLSCLWNLSQPAVASVIPTIIQEIGEGARPIEDKIAELANIPLDVKLSAEELEEIAAIGNNKGCMTLKGGSHEHEGDALPDRWELTGDLKETGSRWGITPEQDLANLHAS
ncbi:MAG: aryl-alcohol dehydrogenase-like predicted oxidoreductase [Verrucomicrobiales bacterium]|jgi:aryl-alcohol dehydrogenase-like predicted oxidoreductase